MRIVCVADTHGIEPLPQIPPCTLLVVAGDVESCYLDPHDSDGQRHYLQTVFADWLSAAPAREIVAVSGNHDFLATHDPAFMRSLPWHYLLDETVVLSGLTIHGSPWTPPFFDWAFMLPERELAAKWQLIPEHCELLLTHGPPYGCGDRTADWWTGGIRDPHQGSSSLRAVVERLPHLRLHVFGHIHAAYGDGFLQRAGLPPLHWLNCSSVDDHYEPRRAPVVIDL